MMHFLNHIKESTENRQKNVKMQILNIKYKGDQTRKEKTLIKVKLQKMVKNINLLDSQNIPYNSRQELHEFCQNQNIRLTTLEPKQKKSPELT